MLNLNTSPYFDDYVTEKKFSRILFKPGVSVQARELTQLQDILQAQIERFGDNIFTNGTIITGCAESHNFSVPYIKVNDISESLSSYVGQTIQDANGIAAIIKAVQPGSVASAPNLNTLYVQYIANNTLPVTINSTTYAAGELSFFPDGDSLLINGTATFTVATNGTGFGSLLELSDGIVYANGQFVLHSDQTVVIDRYNTTPNSQTINVGYVLNEYIITSDDDPTLLDPASGSYNFNAPGADRYVISTVLTAYNADTEIAPFGFFLLFVVENGVITRRYDKTQYAELGVELAQRTYDEAGDYTVKNFPLFVSEHLNNGSNHGVYSANTGGNLGELVIGVQPGKAYVRGYEQELYSTQNLSIPKGIDTRTAYTEYVSTEFGNYVLVDEFAGPWNINIGATVELHNTIPTGVKAVTNGTFSGTVAPSSKIGTARLRAIQYVSSVGSIYRPGQPAAKYQMFLSDIILTGGSFSSVGTIYFPATSDSYGDACFADTVLTGSPLSCPGMQDTKYTSLLFPLTRENAKALSSSSFTATKAYTAIVGTGGTFTITATGSDTWAFSALTNFTLDENIIVIAKTAFSGGTLGTIPTGKPFDLAASAVTVTSPTTLSFNLGYTTTGTPSVLVLVNVKSVDLCNAKTYVPNVYVQFNTDVHGAVNGTEQGTLASPFLLGVHDTFSIDNVWLNGGPTTTGPATLAALLADPTWEDVTTDFFLVSGTTDSQYGIDGIASNKTYVSKSIIVKFSWLSHASSTGYYSVQSYPIPPTENTVPTSTQINWWQIPKYTATNGVTYNLRDTLDFRYTIAPAAGAGTAVTPNAATVNPILTTTLLGGVTTPSDTGTFITNIQYYLPRIDRVILDSDGNFLAVHGAASDAPVAPKQPNNSMTLGFVNIPAYPSLSPYYARVVNRQEYATSITLTDNRRFTMKDVGVIQSRLDRLEYQASLSSLEESAAELQILNSSGVDRHKNGILVDSFIGHNVGNVYDPAYNCSIADGILRPAFTLDSIAFNLDASTINIVQNAPDANIVVRQTLPAVSFSIGDVATGSGGGSGTIAHIVPIATNSTYQWVRLYLNDVVGGFAPSNTVASSTASGTITYTGLSPSTLPATLQPSLVYVPSSTDKLATLPYIHSVYADNLQATQSRGCASAVLFTFEGTVSLNPPSDMWMDTGVHAEVQTNLNNFFDNWKVLNAAWGTQWNDWKALWFGKSTEVPAPINNTLLSTALTTQQRQSIQGISLASRIDTMGNVIPFIRSQVITFTATRLKATTTLHAYFDGVDVTAFCKNNADSGFGSLATPLITDNNGTIIGQFQLPAETFTTGSKSFVLTDASDPQSTNLTTVAVGTFTASGQGTFEERTIVSTRKANTTIDSQRQTQNLVVSRQVTTSNISNVADPLSQTFFISNSDGGVLVTKIDVYFQARSTINSITLQLREVVNGYPTNTIIPFGEVTLLPSDVNVSVDGSSPTEFRFSAPVYLKNNTEYCFSLVPTGNDPSYAVWESVVGQTLIGSTEVADKQPNLGSMFVVNNNRAWVELLNESVTCSIYTAAFNPLVSGTLVLSNNDIDYVTLIPTNPGYVVNVGDIITGTPATKAAGSTGIGTVQYIHALSAQEIQNLISILVANGSTLQQATQDAATAIDAQITITSGAFLPSDAFANGSIILTNRIVTAIAPAISQLAFTVAPVTWNYQIYQSSGAPYTGFNSLDISGTTELASEAAVFSHSTLAKTFQLQGILSTTQTNIAPVIDLTKTSCVVVYNSIDNLLAGNQAGGNNENYPAPGLALSKYISRTVVLNDGEDAQDLRVYFSAFFPSSSGVQVWAKILNIADPTPFANCLWRQMYMNAITTSAQYDDYFFTLLPSLTPSVPFTYTSNTGASYTGFRTFAIKIVLTSGTSVQVPTIKDLRAIALLI